VCNFYAPTAADVAATLFAPHGERSVARGYMKALSQARELIYVEEQYLWSRDVGRRIADRLRAHPRLHLIAVLPHHPDQDGLSLPPNIVGRQSALSVIRAAASESLHQRKARIQGHRHDALNPTAHALLPETVAGISRLRASPLASPAPGRCCVTAPGAPVPRPL
jgi:hypothetical protein